MAIQTRNIVGNRESKPTDSLFNNESVGNVTQTDTQKNIEGLASSGREYVQEVVNSYDSLTLGSKDGILAFVENSQGTAWLPYNLGGTYYPKGWYVWDEPTKSWASSRSQVAEGISTASGAANNALEPGDNVSLLTNDANYLTTVPTISYNSLSNRPSLFSGSYTDLTSKPSLFDGNYANLSNKPSIPTNISELTNDSGYLTVDNDTQRTDQEIRDVIALEGYGTSNFDGDYANLTNKPTIPTQITDSEIAALGYVKTDNDTQLTDADITALGYVKTSGTTVTFFQVQDDGITGQAVTNGYQNVAGLWDTPSLTDSDFTFDNSLGHLTVKKDGVIEIDAKLVSYNTGNNRHELYIELQKNGVSLISDAQYASRNLTQRLGGAYIMGFKDSCSVGDIYKLRTKRVGVTADLGTNTGAGMSYFSAKLYS